MGGEGSIHSVRFCTDIIEFIPSRNRRTAARSDERRPTVIRPLNDLFTEAVNYKTYRLERHSARFDSTVARHINRDRKKWTCR